jgi:hypothetical protein
MKPSAEKPGAAAPVDHVFWQSCRSKQTPSTVLIANWTFPFFLNSVPDALWHKQGLLAGELSSNVGEYLGQRLSQSGVEICLTCWISSSGKNFPGRGTIAEVDPQACPLVRKH